MGDDDDDDGIVFRNEDEVRNSVCVDEAEEEHTELGPDADEDEDDEDQAYQVERERERERGSFIRLTFQ